MEQRKKPRSLRTFVLATVGIAVLGCIAVFICVFLGNMVQMLKQAERTHLAELSATMHGLFDAAAKNLQAGVRTWASRDDTCAWIQGGRNEFLEASLESGVLGSSGKVDFVIIRDSAGRDVYVGFRSNVLNSSELLPDGLSRRISSIAADVLKNNLSSPTGERYSDTGFIEDEGRYWLICVMPVLPSNEAGDAVGTFTVALPCSEAWFKRLTHLDNTRFRIREQDPRSPLTEDRYDLTVKDVISMHMVLNALGNSRNVVLELEHPRILYADGWTLVLWTTCLLSFALLVVMLGFFLILERFLLRPLGQLVSDIQGVDRGVVSIDTQKYTRHREFHTLSLAINDMLDRMYRSHRAEAESRVSMNVLKNILDGLDASLSVSDPETDEILFVNEKMKKRFDASNDGAEESCRKVLQPGPEERCDFCPSSELQKNPSGTVEWEELNTVTGRYYHNTDRLIDWIGDKKAHLRHSVDITDIKAAEVALKKRLTQQSLMTAISRNFISKEKSEIRITRALQMTGKFLNIARILLLSYDARERNLECLNEWHDTRQDVSPGIGEVFSLGASDLSLLDSLADGSVAYISSNEDGGKIRPGGKADEMPGFLSIPVFRDSALWGLLDLGRPDAGEKWTESDIDLARLVASLLSGVLSRRQVEEQLHRLSAIVEFSPRYISYVGEDGSLLYVNPAAEKISGYTQQEILEGGLGLLYSKETACRIREEFIPQTLQNGEGSFEIELIRRDGEKRILAFSSFLTGGDVIDICGIADDVTEMRKLEAELIAAKELAEQGSRSKSDFLSRMSHEMRTPMNAIIGMTGIARSSDDPGKKEYCLEKIANASRHLLGVINDILDMSKIEANKFELSLSEFSFDRMIMNVVNVVSFRMEEKSQRFSLYIDPAIPPSLTGDEQRLAQVITNLLTNAAKFTPEKGRIRLSARVVNDEVSPDPAKRGSLTLQIMVADSGIGIVKDQQEKLFRSFEQADGSIARKFGGTGLGLAISKRIVELMGGEIGVESEPNVGSKFSFTVKMEKGEKSFPEVSGREIDLRELNVLAVDDSSETRDYFLHVMGEWGIPCAVASDSGKALEMVAASEKPFDLIFVDWKMPYMNGIELTWELRKKKGDRSIIIMISVAEWSEIEKEATRAGVDGFLPKPLFPSLIMDCINKYLSRASYGKAKETPETKSPEQNTVAAFSGKTALLAEDVNINREIVVTILEGTELTIDCAVNGVEAVRMFAGNPSRYDIVFMDLHMPEMDGLEATRQIRALDFPEAKRVPIIAMTADVFKEDIEQCLSVGMNDHIGKPIDFDQLFLMLTKYLSSPDARS